MKIIRENFSGFGDGRIYNLAEEKSQKRTIKIREIQYRLAFSTFYDNLVLPEIYYLSIYEERRGTLLLLIDKQYNMIEFNNATATSCIPVIWYLSIQESVDYFWNTPFDVLKKYEGITNRLMSPREITNLLRMKNENH